MEVDGAKGWGGVTGVARKTGVVLQVMVGWFELIYFMFDKLRIFFIIKKTYFG